MADVAVDRTPKGRPAPGPEQKRDTVRVQIKQETDIITARRAGQDRARDLGFGSADQIRMATAISELARNIIRYAGEGTCVISDESNGTVATVRAVVEDNGPGIADVKAAMTDGFTTGRSMGMGLPGTKRLVHDFQIDSKPGLTRVAISISRTAGGSATSRLRGAAAARR